MSIDDSLEADGRYNEYNDIPSFPRYMIIDDSLEADGREYIKMNLGRVSRTL